MPRPKKVEPPVGWPLLCGLALCTAKCPKPEWSEARKCWSGLAARSPMATHWIYKINQHERMYEVLGIQLVSVWSMCISTLVSSVIVSHFLDTSMIVQVESIRHLSYCLQAESCKWQVQPSPLLLGRESRIISAWVQNRHWGWDDIGRAEVVPPFLFFFIFFHLVTSGQRQHGLGRAEFLTIRKCGPSLMILGWQWRGVTCWRGFRQGWFVLNLYEFISLWIWTFIFENQGRDLQNE